jgi:5-methylcytosine-specific restriction endonuclease McrA
MGKKLATTPRSRVRSALRACWLRSRERAAALKRDKNTCQNCGRKGSKAKGREVTIEVHHLDEGGIQWDKILDYVYRHLLVDPSRLACVCKECHATEHEDEEKKLCGL